MSEQLRLFEQAEERYAPDELLLGEGNRGAHALLFGEAPWPGGALALIGPEGSGKTHLATAWALKRAAPILGPEASAGEVRQRFHEAGGCLLLDHADNLAEAALWLALDLARLEGGAVLLTARLRPPAWNATSPDLRSRLAALAVCEIAPPDLDLLAGLLRRLARRRYLEMDVQVAEYCAQRMPRRWDAAQKFIAALDRACFRGVEPISYDAARRALRSAFPDALTQVEDDAPWETQHD